MKLKKFLLLFMSTILFFGLAACSSEETKSGASDSKEKVELRVAWWGGQARHDKMNELFDLFEEKIQISQSLENLQWKTNMRRNLQHRQREEMLQM